MDDMEKFELGDDPALAESIEHTVTEEYLKVFPRLEGEYSFHLCDSADGISL